VNFKWGGGRWGIIVLHALTSLHARVVAGGGGGLGIVGNEHSRKEQLVRQFRNVIHTVQEERKYEVVKKLPRCSHVVLHRKRKLPPSK
jgi:hypothetical protein